MALPHSSLDEFLEEIIDMRVLILTVEFPPFLVGGLGRHTADLSRALTDDGHIVDVVTAVRTGSGVNEARSASPTVYRGVCSPAPDSWQQWFLCANMAMIRTLYEIPERRWDVIHIHERSSVYAAQVATRICNAPAVYARLILDHSGA
jgi:glycosyltransferase involved in cell wall biosynthesis